MTFRSNNTDTGGRELTEPTVTCETQDCLDRICRLSLRCSVTGDGFGNVSYTWKGWGYLWDERPVVLTVVDKSSLDELDPLRCMAQNTVSSRSVTVTTPEGLCPGSWPARTARMARLASCLAEISATALLGLQDSLQAVTCLGPVPGPASDQFRPGLRRTLSAPEPITDLLRPEPGPVLDEHGSGSGWSISALPWATDALRPEAGLVLDKHRPGLG
ncbi:hypothetical protein HGM15179_020588 [Zosterops borbonicus]|uniref:Ig-like domain-containing protein n=1 Tax=Zosterops borbonicus TaxID=364589 RepID=A0A8K1FUV8_9PASS|nr:hypothetical protein HGM15179_020588 [Zosterops borbonicus]